MDDKKDKSFLGKGWAFPPQFHEGLNPVKMTADEEDIEESLRILLSTRRGERTMRPEFGTDMHHKVYHNMDLTMRTQLRAAIEKAVLYYEPRITLTHVQFDVSEERDGVLRVLLEYVVRQTNARGNMVYPYYYEEHF